MAGRPWTAEELAEIRRGYADASENIPTRTVGQVYKMAQRLGLQRDIRRAPAAGSAHGGRSGPRVWSPERDGQLRSHVVDGAVDIDAALRAMPERSYMSLYHRSLKLGLTVRGLDPPKPRRVHVPPYPERVADFRRRVAEGCVRDGDCLIWTGATATSGHAQINLRLEDDSRERIGPRALWIIDHGPIPHGLYVLHTCDRAPCMNGSHHYLGTPLQNMRDRSERSRWTESVKSRTIDRYGEAVVTMIKLAHTDGKNYRQIAKATGLPYADVRRLCIQNRGVA